MRTIIILFLFISGCSTIFQIEEKNLVVYNRPSKIESDFYISGRFFVQIPQDSYYGNFDWKHNKGGDSIILKSPLGQIFATIDTDSQSHNISLITNKKQYNGSNVRIIMEDNLGFYLPLDYLYYWICGVSVDKYRIDKYFYNGFSQIGFDVYYISWYDINHPKYIKISNSTMLIKLFLNWK